MEKLKKWMAGLLCMMLVITMVAGLGVTEVKADTVTEVSTWDGLETAVRNGGNIRLAANITAGEDNSAIYISNNTVTVDLAGYTIDRACTEEKTDGNVFNVTPGGNLTIKDTSENETGKITRGSGGRYNSSFTENGR